MKIKRLREFRDNYLKLNRLHDNWAMNSQWQCEVLGALLSLVCVVGLFAGTRVHAQSRSQETLTPRLAVPPLPRGEGEKSGSHPSPKGEGARRRRAGEGSLRRPLDFDGGLTPRRKALSDLHHDAMLVDLNSFSPVT
jgi:hypothetical protein